MSDQSRGTGEFDLEYYRQYYDRFYGERDFDHFSEAITRQMLRQLRNRFFPTGTRVLDVGCGTGVQIQVMNKLGLNATGIDLSFVGLRAARQRTPLADLIQCDATRQPFIDASFDAAVSFGCSLMNSPAFAITQHFIAESLRLIRPGGWLVITSASDFTESTKRGWRQQPFERFVELLQPYSGEKKIFVTFTRLFPLLRGFALSRTVTWALRHLPLRNSRMILLAVRAPLTKEN